MARTAVLLFFSFSFLISVISAEQNVTYTDDKEFLQKQLFVYQLLWSPEDLIVDHPDVVEKAAKFKIQDLRALTVNQDAVDEFIERYNHGLLPRGNSCTAFNPDHLAEIRNFVDVLLGANDFKTFAVIATWSGDVLNQILWFFGVAVAVLHRRDTQHLRLPNLHETLPFYFYDNESVMNDYYKVRRRLCKEQGKRESTRRSWKPWSNTEESLSYFTEDVGLSNFYFYLNLELPFWMEGVKYNLSSYRRGEQYFNDHKQLLARYNLERLSNDLPEMEDIDWNGRIVTGFYPDMSDYNGVPFPNRPDNAEIPSDKLKFAQMAKGYESRLETAADGELLLGKNGSIIFGVNKTETEFFNDLMNAVQGNADSPNQQFYGSFDAVGRHVLGFSPEPINKSNVTVSAMENLNADLRDPAFYRLYKKIVDIGLRYKSHRKPYAFKDVAYRGVEINDIQVDKMVTYFEKFRSIIGSNECPSLKKKPFYVVQHRLNHEDFRISLNVSSSVAHEKAIIRIFLGPKYGAHREPLDIDKAQHKFFQLDKFVVTLKQGVNKIERRNRDFAFQVPEDIRSDEFYEDLKKAVNGESGFGYLERPYGYPLRLMIPQGKRKGLPLQLFVIVNQFIDISKVVSARSRIAGKEFIDGRSLGFPFDRPIESFRFDAKNLAFKDVIVYHK